MIEDYRIRYCAFFNMMQFHSYIIPQIRLWFNDCGRSRAQGNRASECVCRGLQAHMPGL